MAKHIITGTAAPVDAPTELGQHFVDTATPAIYFSVGTATAADWKLVQEAGLLGTIAIQDANAVAITGGSITNLTTLELPVSATPAVATDGEIALDTTVADFSHGVIKFYGTEEQGVVSMPIAQFTAPTDGYAVTYSAANDEFVLAASVGAVASVNGLTGAVSLNGGYIGVKGADIASAGTTDLSTATGDWVDVTGTTTITALGTVTAGVERLVRFTGILTLTHNATSLILPTGANITTATGDFARFRSLGSGNWVCVAYQRASGGALAGGTGTAGRHAIWVAAGSMTPSATGGCGALATIASAANQPDIQTLDFDPTTQEYAQFSIRMPKSWNEGTITFAPVWSHAATTTDFGVVWDLQAVAVSNDDAIAVAFGTAQTSTDTGGTTNDIYIGPESSAITVSGTPAAEDVVFFRLSRVTGNGSDTMAIDARLHGITLYITTDAENDA